MNLDVGQGQKDKRSHIYIFIVEIIALKDLTRK